MAILGGEHFQVYMAGKKPSVKKRPKTVVKKTSSRQSTSEKTPKNNPDSAGSKESGND